MDDKKKEEAIHALKKKKNIKENVKECKKKIEFLDRQLTNIENQINEVGFVNAVKDSNRVLEKLNNEMDMEEVRLAKQLQEEGKMRKEELMDLLSGDDEEDQELKKQLDDIESEMIEQALSKFSNMSTDTGYIDTFREEQKKHIITLEL